MKLIRRIEDKTGKEIKELYHEFMDLPRNARIAIDAGLIFLMFLILASITPALKYTLLNAFGSSDTKIKVVDSQLGLPIFEAKVTIEGREYTTDANGIVDVEGLNFGDHDVAIDKPGYEQVKTSYVLKEESNSFEEAIRSNGKRVTVRAKQYLSGKPVEDFVVRSTDGDNLSAVGVDGIAVLVVPSETTLEIGAKVSAEYYLDKIVSLNTRETKIKNDLILVPSGEHYFLASRGGATTIYKSQLDGSAQERFIEPTGFEGGDSKLYVAPGGEFAVYEAARKPGGKALNLVNLKTKEVKEFDSGAATWNMIYVDDNQVVYIYDRSDPANDKNQTLKTFNFKTGEAKELFDSRNMQMATHANGKVVFAEMIERGSYPGGYILRQLISVSTESGEVVKLSEDLTVTDIRRINPTKIQYSQINPNNNAVVDFVYDTSADKAYQAQTSNPAREFLASPFAQDYFAWTSGATDLSLGDSEATAESTYSYNANLKAKRWINENYLILHSADGSVGSRGLLVYVDSGATGQLP
jgi:hypothetical protein